MKSNAVKSTRHGMAYHGCWVFSTHKRKRKKTCSIMNSGNLCLIMTG